MKASFSIKTQDILSAFGSIKSNQNRDVRKIASSVLLAIVSDNNTRTAILPPTVGWFVLTLDCETTDIEGAKLRVLGTNADGYLVFLLLDETTSSQLCVLRRGERVTLNCESDDSVATLYYNDNSVELRLTTKLGQQFLKNIINFTGQVPRSKIGKGESIARPMDDKGVDRLYLDHSLVNIVGERVPISFARTEHKTKATYPKHAHADDNVRVICSGVYRFTIFDPQTDSVVHECEVASGDTIQVPAGYAYVEEVLEPGVVINGRSTKHLHYRLDTPAQLGKSIDVTLSRGILEKK